MSIIKTKIGNLRATWVLRHRWEAGAKDGMISNYEGNDIRMNWQLGIWAKRYKVVGRGKGKSIFDTENLVNCYMIGLDLIVCKVWVDFSFRPTLGN